MSALIAHHTREIAHLPPGGYLRGERVSDLIAPDTPCDGIACRSAHDWDDFHHQRYFDTAYAWLADQVGFWPVFLTVGSDPYEEWATGYAHQFRRGEAPRVMFSFADIPAHAVFIDDGGWNAVLNRVRGDGCREWHMTDIDGSTRHALFRPGRSRDRWLHAARRRPGSVQLIAPTLPLIDADRICVPSRSTAQALVARGYPASRMHTLRMRVDPFPATTDYAFAPHSAPLALVK